MPLVEHIQLPTFERLRESGQEVLSLNHALKQDIRELHIGLLNMMPDAALQVTEQQFMKLIGNSNQIAQIYVHPFSVPGLPRSPETQSYIEEYYTTFEQLQDEGLDALIITGANVSNPRLELEPFWGPLTKVMEWASERVTSVLCSCLATHSLMKYMYKIDRQLLPQKQWGVYAHRIAKPAHPLLRDINTRFDVPHSRYNTITRDQFERAGLTILIDSPQAGVHMAVSPDQFRSIYLQGHPEYHTNSLLKEYKREIIRYLNDEREQPPYPENYLSPQARAIGDAYITAAEKAKQAGDPIPEFPEEAILPFLDNTWNDTGKAIFNNWLGLVYRLTHVDRDKLFMPGVDPENPLGLL
ncbi:MAG: homoserine O-succinyltransferase [Anaerolineae bacterium]|nr:homoserine O-succinyltransferase [Anaerolineae bacterium]